MSIDRRREAAIGLLNTREGYFVASTPKPTQWPECDRPKECRASTSQFSGGLANNTYREPTVDREGNVHEPPAIPPTITRNWRCETCGKTWSETTRFGA